MACIQGSGSFGLVSADTLAVAADTQSEATETSRRAAQAQGALNLLSALEERGITVTVVGPRLVVSPATRLQPPDRYALHAYRDAIRHLRADSTEDELWREMYEERAAIVEFDGEVVRSDAEVIAAILIRRLKAGRLRQSLTEPHP